MRGCCDIGFLKIDNFSINVEKTLILYGLLFSVGEVNYWGVNAVRFWAKPLKPR